MITGDESGFATPHTVEDEEPSTPNRPDDVEEFRISLSGLSSCVCDMVWWNMDNCRQRGRVRDHTHSSSFYSMQNKKI